MHNVNKDIITALATPYGKSAIAVIRLSGKGCIEFTEKYLKHKLKEKEIKLNTFNGIDFSEKLMAVAFCSPFSYTGEDMVELYPHGNMTICDGIIKTLISGGARIAERGEFTKRAFLNGKADLMKCEALADIIDAQTSEALVYGNKRYDGVFKSLTDVENSIKKALSTIEAILHYGDELEGEERDEGLINDVYGVLDDIIVKLEDEIKGYAGGKIVNEGCKVALIGKPNVGKSTLLNALVEKDRAIVTPIAGTTRDTIDEKYIYKGKLFIVTDTAGLNADATDEVEKIGIERSKRAEEQADIVVYVTDSDEHITSEKNYITVKNKSDSEKDVGQQYIKAEQNGILKISAKNSINIEALKCKIYDVCPKDVGGICNHRQFDCVTRCLNSCIEARNESKKADGLEIVAAALYDAYSAITSLYGENADERVLDEVFDRFCVGK